MEDIDYIHHKMHIPELTSILERIAVAQEALLAIAQEARKERTALSDQMKKAFQQPLQEK